jgi:hypothetical protein
MRKKTDDCKPMRSQSALHFQTAISHTAAMPHWMIKAALQRGISFLPSSHKWNELFQKHVTKSIVLTHDRFEERAKFCARHLQNYSSLRPQAGEAFTAMEVGTGWYPTVPVGLFLCGASKVWTYDIAPMLASDRVHRLLRKYADLIESGSLQKILPQALPARMEQLSRLVEDSRNESPYTFLEKLNIHARVQDAQQTGLESGTVDLFVSTGVLEYIPRPVLVNILGEFQRVATPGGVMSHYLNLIDQYWYFDKSITPFNFLKYTAARWEYFNSPITWQNRLRISDYRELITSAGFKIEMEASESGQASDLDKIQLAPEFQKYSQADLLVIISWLAARSIADKSAARP